MIPNIIDCVKILKKNKNSFDNINDYNKILTNLYKQYSIMSELEENTIKKLNIETLNSLNDSFEDININDISDEINKSNKYKNFLVQFSNVKSRLQANTIKNIDFFSSKHKLFEIYLIINDIIQIPSNSNLKIYIVQENPITNSSNKDFSSEIKVLLNLFDVMNVGDENILRKSKAVILIAMYDIIMKNYKIVINNNKFCAIIKNKFDEILNNPRIMNTIKQISCEFIINENFIDTWTEIFENINLS